MKAAKAWPVNQGVGIKRRVRNEILESPAAIQETTAKINIETFRNTCLLCSAIEREFTICSPAPAPLNQDN